ncbi:hypothetical protein ABT301_21980 [Streptomyces sp. NPDC000987]|uniref:hypothetical protein n=1 Tax=Streptomyces sp. NPDC000987 TaxID=3154374 RepID=UPI003319E419
MRTATGVFESPGASRNRTGGFGRRVDAGIARSEDTAGERRRAPRPDGTPLFDRRPDPLDDVQPLVDPAEFGRHLGGSNHRRASTGLLMPAEARLSPHPRRYSTDPWRSPGAALMRAGVIR